MPEQLLIGFNPMSATNRVAFARSQIRGRVLWLVFSVVICAVIYMWRRDVFTPAYAALLFGIGISYSLVWLIISIVNYQRAKKILASITPGVAISVDRNGMWLRGVGIPWYEVEKINITPGRFGGSPNLNVTRDNGLMASISLADLDVMPGTIDAAIRSYSAGTQHIDTSRLGN